MATTTPNYGWPVPTSTDYVKDGATAIEALGDAIDATVFGLGAGALTLINTTTFSAVATQSFNSVFSATYDHYVIKGRVTTSANNFIYFRVRSGTTDLTTSTYIRGGYYVGAGASVGFTAENNVTDTSAILASTSVDYGAIDATIFNPFSANYTQYVSSGTGRFTSNFGGVVNNTTSYNGISLITGGGTISGTVSIYGVAK